jgi:hypothetical protein
MRNALRSGMIYGLLVMCIIVICALTLTVVRSAPPPLIPLELLFENARFCNPKVSPDGKYVSFLAPRKGVMNIWLRSIDDGHDARAVTHDTGRGIHNYRWGYDNASLFFLQDQNGDENNHL